MIASFPMYDWPEQSKHWDAFWAVLRATLQQRGFPAPEALSRGSNPWDDWLSPELLISQTCGLPYRMRLHDKVTLIGAFDFGLPGCAPGHYSSVIVARHGMTIAAGAAGKLAYNASDSQSGWAALYDAFRTLGLSVGATKHSGSHRASVRLVAEGDADIAAIDAETWRLVEAHDPDVAQALTVLDRTPCSPGLPLISQAGADPSPLADAVHDAIISVDADTREALHMKGFVRFAPNDYLNLPIPPAPPATGPQV